MSAEKTNGKDEEASKGKLKLVMVVEDEQALANMLCQLMKFAGFEFILAKDGQDALDKLEKKTPDAVVLDIVMPKLDGWEVCRRIKSERDTEKIPIVIYSTLSNSKDVEKGIELGADWHIGKDKSAMEVLEAVKRLLDSVKK